MNYQYWFGTEASHYGYGAMLEGFRSGLPAGVQFHDQASVAVLMYDPSKPHSFLRGQHRALYTMWETSVLPPKYYRLLGGYDQVIVPCEHNRELFAPYAKNISVVPLGVDIKFWKPTPRPANKRFRFHAGGSMWLRKGLDVVVEAFEKAGIDAELHIKVPLERLVPKRSWPSNIVLHTGWMSKWDQFEWYNKADCFIGASRGEGFGLMPLQAMALGIPTIITATSGQAQYAHLASAVIPTTPKRCDVHEITNFAGFWDEPDLDALVEALRKVYAGSDVYRYKAMFHVKHVAEYRWAKSCEKLLAVLPEGDIIENPIQEPLSCYLTIEVNRKCEAGVNNDHWYFVPGVVYKVDHVVYDILDNANYIKSFKILERSNSYENDGQKRVEIHVEE